jgi:hypothetical protein
MDVYLTKQAQKWAKGNVVTNTALKDAAAEVAAGHNDGDHGAGVYKKRIAAKKGKGKSGGGRTLLAWNHGERVVYMFGYDKSELDVVPKKALKAIKAAAKVWKAKTDEEMKKAVEDGHVKEI